MRSDFLFIVLFLLSTVPALAIEPSELRFLEGLRQRRLFETGADFCREKLADQNLSAADRATLTIELARCRAGKALNATRSERDAHWQAAAETLSEFARRHPNHPRRFLIRVQEALVLLARGELARQEAEVGAEAEAALADAREQIREAARRLEELERDLEREAPRRLNARLAEGDLTAEELASLLDNVRRQLARAYRNQALAYPPGSADRVAALTQAVNRLNPLRQSIAEGDPLYWSCRLDLALCHRLLEKPNEALRQLAEIESQNAPASVLVEALAERIRLLLAAGRTDKALEAVSRGRKVQGAVSPELDLAHLEAYIALAKQAESQSEANDATAWRNKAVAITRLIEESHGPYWRRRADSLLTGSIGGSPAAGDLEILIRTARDHYLRKRSDEAIQAYDDAAQQAQATGDAKQAFELFYRAAAIEHERKNHREAARRFLDAAMSFTTQPDAAEAHLLGCFHLAQAAREDPSQLEEYATALEEHVRLWPNEPDSARLWLGKLRESQRRWGDAVEAYRGVAATHGDYEAAVAGAARGWLRLLDERKDSPEDLRLEADQAARFFERVVFEAKADSPPNQLAAARAAALAAAKVHLSHAANGHASAERVLRAALDEFPDPPPAWRAEATGLLVVALAGQPQRVDEALGMLRGAATDSPQPLWETIQSLAALMEESPQTSRSQLANLVLQALERLAPGQTQLSPEDQIAAERLRAEALAAAGRFDEAKALYEQLAKRHPQDGRIQEGYGELLLTRDDAATRALALGQWRLVGQGSRPRSERWWRAKYHVALLHFQNGDREQAAQLIRYLQAVPPGLDDSPLREEFLTLLRRCE